MKKSAPRQTFSTGWGRPPKRGPPFSLVKNGKGNSTGRKGVRGKPRRGFLRVFNQKFSELPALKTCSGWRKCVFDRLGRPPKRGPPFSLVKNGKGNSTGRKGVRGKPRRGFLRVFNQKFSELPALKTCSGWRKCVFDSLRAAPKGGPPFRCHWSCPPRRVENQAKKAAAASARCSGGSWSLVHVSASLDTARRSAENGAAAATVTQPSPCRSRTRMP